MPALENRPLRDCGSPIRAMNVASEWHRSIIRPWSSWTARPRGRFAAAGRWDETTAV